MNEAAGDLWQYHRDGHYIGVTTNGHANKRGECTMGRGIAWQASKHYPSLPKHLGNSIKKSGNIVHYFHEIRIVTIPVKHNWWELADLELIKQSCIELSVSFKGKLYMPRPGCGNGGLDWSVVRPVISQILGNNITIVEWKKSE